MRIELFDVFYYFFVILQGLTLSGGEQKNMQQKLIDGLEDKFPSICKPSKYYITTDTYGPVATAFPNGMLPVMNEIFS